MKCFSQTHSSRIRWSSTEARCACTACRRAGTSASLCGRNSWSAKGGDSHIMRPQHSKCSNDPDQEASEKVLILGSGLVPDRACHAVRVAVAWPGGFPRHPGRTVKRFIHALWHVCAGFLGCLSRVVCLLACGRRAGPCEYDLLMMGFLSAVFVTTRGAISYCAVHALGPHSFFRIHVCT